MWMMGYVALAARLRTAGCRTFWFGKASPGDIENAALYLGVRFSESFADFLLELGGGGVEGAELNGVAPGGDLDGGGTVTRATAELRARLDLSASLVVLRVDDDEWLECLDCSDGRILGFEPGEDVAGAAILAPDFGAYFSNYVVEQCSIERDS